jgi:undecaprenyl-diphosphatase
MPFVLFALAIAWAVMLLFGGLDLDRALLLTLHGGGRPEVERAARILSLYGSDAVLMLLAAASTLWLLWKRRFRSAALLIALSVSGRLLVELQKIQLAGVRPQDNVPPVKVESLSFPSVHAASAAIVYLGLALLLTTSFPRRAIALWAAAWLTILVGASRVALGAQWPSDVIAGWAFGLFWVLLLLSTAGHELGDGAARSRPGSDRARD